MRSLLVLIVVLGQLALLSYMVWQRETLLRQGETLYMQTAPVDPRDPLRGDYVRLSYPANAVARSDYRGPLPRQALQRGQQVYAVIKPTSEDLYRLDYLLSEPPSQGMFLKGRVLSLPGNGAIRVKYGIEQYFVEQGAGLEIESIRGGREGFQRPMEVELAVGQDGSALIRGYRWSPLALAMTLLESERNDSALPGLEAPRRGPESPTVRLRLRNVSKSPVALVDNVDHCGFTLQPLGDSDRQIQRVDKRCSGYQYGPQDRIDLAPGEEYAIDIDLAKRRWFVSTEGKDGELVGDIAAVAPGERFRLIYRSPPAGSIPSQVWQGELQTPAFTVWGRVD